MNAGHVAAGLLAAALAALPALGPSAVVVAAEERNDARPLPEHLAETGLYAPGSTTRTAAGVRPFSPQYPLWSDGSRKQRWIRLPPDSAIDASEPDAWEFPAGTRLWKEFRDGERRVETRYLERLADGRWRFAAYVWNADGSEAQLAPEHGLVLSGVGPGGRYRIPSRGDCLACHEGPSVPVLGFSALQLSPERDPLAPHAEPARAEELDLRGLLADGLIVNLPPALIESPPRVEAATPTERAALGYLHGNCGHCHDPSGALDGLGLALAQRASRDAGSVKLALESLLDHESRYRPTGSTGRVARIARRGDQGSGTLLLRLRAQDSLTRMPPLGVQLTDREGVALVERWIHELQHDPSLEARR